MITITGFGTEITEHGLISYLSLVLPSGEGVKMAAPQDFVQDIMELLKYAEAQRTAVLDDGVSKHAAYRPKPAPEPEPYVLEPEEEGFEPSFPAVSQAPGKVREKPKEVEQFSAKSLLSSILGGGGAKKSQVGNTARAQKPQQRAAAPSRVVTALPAGEFFHFFSED